MVRTIDDAGFPAMTAARHSPRSRCRRLAWVAALVLCFRPCPVAAEPAADAPKSFAHRGFYLHEGWLFRHPFAVRSWKPEDFAAMYRLLGRLGFDRVMNWPMFEAIPAPLSAADAQALRDYRRTIEDAHAAGLEFWIAQCANLTPPPSIAAKPWKERNPYPVWKRVRLDDPAEAAAYFAHRRAMMEIVNTADAYVTIDGDPGGYAGAKPQEWLSVFRADRVTLDACGKAAARQPVVPWVWCGWGTERVWGGNPNNPPERIAPFVKASLEVLAAGMPEPWLLLPGRSSRVDWANGRVNVNLAAEAGLIPRSTIFLYEAIEYEPSIPGSNLQFDDIRRMLRDEAKHAAAADGVFGNAQQPVMVLPNLYFFARAAADLSYLDTPDEQVLGDLADLLGGPRELLVPAWRCLQLPLDRLPADLPDRLRKASLSGEAGRFIPGGERRYLDILAAEVESRRGFLAAIAKPAGSTAEAAAGLAAATRALVGWWRAHGFVFDGDERTPFAWRFVRGGDVEALRRWVRASGQDQPAVAAAAAALLTASETLGEKEAVTLLGEIIEPADWTAARPLAPGIEHRCWTLATPRPLLVNVVRIDARAPGVGFHATGRTEPWENGKAETRRQTVRGFLDESRRRGVPIAVAVNADAFSLMTAYDREDPTDVLGLAVSGGQPVSRPAGTPSLVVTKSGDLRIETLAEDADLSGIEVAVSGFGICLRDGTPVAGGADLNPRTGFGLSKDRRFLFLMTIDGRQPGSDGATTGELGSLLARAGAADGINMDGGGSTTLAWWNPTTRAAELLNRPVGDGAAWPRAADPATFRPTERTNGSNFGVSLAPGGRIGR